MNHSKIKLSLLLLLTTTTIMSSDNGLPENIISSETQTGSLDDRSDSSEFRPKSWGQYAGSFIPSLNSLATAFTFTGIASLATIANNAKVLNRTVGDDSKHQKYFMGALTLLTLASLGYTRYTAANLQEKVKNLESKMEASETANVAFANELYSIGAKNISLDKTTAKLVDRFTELETVQSEQGETIVKQKTTVDKLSDAANWLENSRQSQRKNGPLLNQFQKRYVKPEDALKAIEKAERELQPKPTLVSKIRSNLTWTKKASDETK